MNTLSKVAVLLLSLAILAVPAVAAMEEDHIFFVIVDPADATNFHITEVPAPGHESVPEHAELRPFFRDSDPEIMEPASSDIAPIPIPDGEFIISPVEKISAEDRDFAYAAVP